MSTTFGELEVPSVQPVTDRTIVVTEPKISIFNHIYNQGMHPYLKLPGRTILSVKLLLQILDPLIFMLPKFHSFPDECHASSCPPHHNTLYHLSRFRPKKYRN
eukprot:Hpha_TRINITY_DN4015_c0_g1::TRINITY_DN4015_c0_g1_i1::g.63577::m.63577